MQGRGQERWTLARTGSVGSGAAPTPLTLGECTLEGEELKILVSPGSVPGLAIPRLLEQVRDLGTATVT